MEVPAPIQLHPPSPDPSSRLNSPEPSGTPDLKRLSQHRAISTFGFGYGMLPIGMDKEASHTEKSLFHTSIGNNVMESVCSLLATENREVNENVDGSNVDEYRVGHDYMGDGKPLNSDHQQDQSDSLQSLKQKDENSAIHAQFLELVGHHRDQNDALQSMTQKDENSLMHAKFHELVEKVNCLCSSSHLQTSNSVSIPVKSQKTLGTISDLQKKVEDLKKQVTEEKKQRQAVAQQLNSFRRESEKVLQQKQKTWENKFRDLQKEKHALSVRLQKLEIGTPRQLLLQGEDVQLSKEELNHLRQEIQEQEALIKGYQLENEKATEMLKEVQRAAKEKENKMAEEMSALMNQLASSQPSRAPKLSNEQVYESLTNFLNLRTEILDAQAREANLIAELDKFKNEKKDLEKKIGELEDMVKFPKKTLLSSDASCQCVIVKDGSMKDSTVEPTERVRVNFISEEGNVGEKLETHQNKENLVNHDEMLLKETTERDQKKILGLQKKMEKMKREYDLKIRELKQQLEKKSNTKNTENEVGLKVKDLETQITQIRSFYMKKIKDLNETINSNKGQLKPENCTESPKTKPTTPSKHMKGHVAKCHKEKVTLLEEMLAEKMTVIKELEEKLLLKANTEESIFDKDSSDVTKNQPSQDDTEQKVSIDESTSNLDRSDNSTDTDKQNTQDTLSANKQQLEFLQTKVLEMEARQNQREIEWKTVLCETKRIMKLEHDMAERKWQLAMEAKNAEIERFQVELEAILEAAIEIRRAQLHKA